MQYPDTQLFIAGVWCDGQSNRTVPVLNPATEEAIGNVAWAERDDLDRALAAAAEGFRVWRDVSAFERSQRLRNAASLFRERADQVARLISLEAGKPLAEARGEALAGADIIDWFAEEARRTYGSVIPSRNADVLQLTVKEPVGPVAAFTPWNFPINQAVRKVAGALAAGCSIVLKAPEETPAACAALLRAFLDAGVTPDALNLVFGDPAAISSYLIPHPVIRKVTFTGSTAIGKHLAMLAGQHMKRITMELGGHAPAIVCEDADPEHALRILAASKFRNAGQVCVSPTRFLIHARHYASFVDGFVAAAERQVLGEGIDPATTMGPLAHARRVQAVEELVGDAVAHGATLRTGGRRAGNKGYFFQPTVLTDVPREARIMNEEPFGPVALLQPFETLDDAIAEANRLPYGLAAYAYTRSNKTASVLARSIESGMVSINHHGLGLPEVPFGGIKDSGYGSEGGAEAIQAYLNTKFVTQLGT